MDIAIANVHLDLGAGRRGTDMGPSAMHVAGLLPKLQQMGHAVRGVASFDAVQSFEMVEPGDASKRFLPVVHDVCKRLADHVEAEFAGGRFPLVLGGDHSQAIGTISGIARVLSKREERLGVIWVDAHTDMNTPQSTPSGNIHGMPLSTLLGRGAPELTALHPGPALRGEDVCVIGARQVDPGEIPLVQELGVRVYTMSELDARGPALCMQEAIERVTDGTTGVHLSFDLDGVDPQDAPGVGTPVPGGLTFRESHMICEMLARTNQLVGMEMVELNPTLDLRNKTGELAVWLILSALGKTIL